MKVRKNFLLKTRRIFSKIKRYIYKTERKILRFNPIIFALMSIPVFAIEANIISIENPTLFQSVNHKVVAFDLGINQCCTVVSEKNLSGSRIEVVQNLLDKRIIPSLIVNKDLKNIFSIREVGLSSCKLKSLTLSFDLTQQYKELYLKEQDDNENVSVYSGHFEPVPGYEEFLVKYRLKEENSVVLPVQDPITEINIEHLNKYNQKQIFGEMVQALQHLTREYGDKIKCDTKKEKHKFSNNDQSIDLVFVFSDKIPVKNQELFSALYGQIYADNFGGHLSDKSDKNVVNLYRIQESDATMMAYLYENYSSRLKDANNPDKKIVILNLGQSGLMMKGLKNTGSKVELTESMVFDNISGNLIDQAIWDVFKKKVEDKIDDESLIEKKIALKSKCLVEQTKMKEKLSADGASYIDVNIDTGEEESVNFNFSVGELEQALNAHKLIETFQNDIKEGLEKMFGKEGKKESDRNVEFVIVGGSLRIPCLQKALKQLSDITINRTLNMDEAPAYGAAYTSLLQDQCKKALLKTVNASKILQSIGFDHCYKPILDRLFTRYIQQIKLQSLRNKIEMDCYNVDNIVDVIKTTNLSNIEKEIREINENNREQGKITDTKQKEEYEQRLGELNRMRVLVVNGKLWVNLKKSSDKISENILKNRNNPLRDNMEFITNLHNCFNNSAIEECKKYPVKISKLEKALYEMSDNYNKKPQEIELVENLKKTTNSKGLKVLKEALNRALTGDYFKICLDLFLKQLKEENPNFSSFDVFEKLFQIRQEKMFDPVIALDIWLYAKLYFHVH